MTTTEENNKNTEKKARPGLKLLLIAGMCVAFLIPQALLQNLVTERSHTESRAENEVFAKWGGNQTLIGPYIEVIYNVEGKTERFYKLILPDELDVNGDVKTRQLKRGIYDFTVYETDVELKGRFKLPKDFDKNMEGMTWHFEKAKVYAQLTNLRGLRDNVVIEMNEIRYDMESSTDAGLVCQVDLSSLLEGNTIAFSMSIPFKGSGQLMFTPIGQVTTVHLSSDCVTPSFDGCYLPEERTVDDKGFEASWKVLAINRNFSQLISISAANLSNKINDSAFGVILKVPVEQYLQTDRAIKYAFLIILLTFAAVFFIEMRKAKPIHPVQYLLIGLALVVFYTLLLSFSEHMNFGLSYLIASVMTIGMIVVFMASVVKDKKTALGIGLLLSVLYAFVYVLLQLETYALLVGSVGIFIVLGIAMFATQKIDWYKKKD